MSRSLAPVAAALLGLLGSLAATVSLYRAAAAALDRVLEERLRGAGETAARLLASGTLRADRLREVMDANRLEGAYVVSPDLDVIADATAPAGGRVDLLRVDAGRLERALHGEATVGTSPGDASGGSVGTSWARTVGTNPGRVVARRSSASSRPLW